MPEWLTDDGALDQGLSAGLLAARLAVALVSGSAIAVLFRYTHGRDKADAAVMVTTLVLLSVLIAMVSMVIGNSVARAFSLVGALSIVRFRTVVDDTRDTAFVIFAVVTGMAAGTGLNLVPVVGIPVVAAAAVTLDVLRRARPNGVELDASLLVRLVLGRDPQAVLGDVLAGHTTTARVVSTATARQGSALDVTYAIRLRNADSLTRLPLELNQIEGVQSVELKRQRNEN